MSLFRKTLRLLSRPKGPNGERVGKEYRLTVPYRTEVTMMRQNNTHRLYHNIRENFRKPIMFNGIRAIPRDLGELPRSFVIKLLFLNQPVRQTDLWELCKQDEHCPLDSSKHLRLVLKIAKLQKWAYVEKNQTNNMWYYYVHQSRTHEVQDMIRADAVEKRDAEARAVEEADQVEQEKKAAASEAMDLAIQSMQHALASNISKIGEFDPAFVRSLPYVTEGGALNFSWQK